MIELIVLVLVFVLVVGVILWALPQLPLDTTLVRLGRVAIIVIAVIAAALWLLQAVNTGRFDTLGA